MSSNPPVCLTIGGSDSGGGAGIQADLATFHALGAFGTTVITSVTAQNTRHVLDRFDLPPESVRLQLRAIFEDFQIAAIKSGMLGSRETVLAVTEVLSSLESRPPFVLDPVMVSSTGHRLLAADAIDALRQHLVPLASIVTPNSEEARALAPESVDCSREDGAHANRILELGASAVLVTGGDEDTDAGHELSSDTLVMRTRTGVEQRVFSAPRVAAAPHGTGCTFSSAICVALAKGLGLIEAIELAKRFTTDAIRHQLAFGSGNGPAHPLWQSWKAETP